MKPNANFACRSIRPSTYGFRNSPRLAVHDLEGEIKHGGNINAVDTAKPTLIRAHC